MHHNLDPCKGHKSPYNILNLGLNVYYIEMAKFTKSYLKFVTLELHNSWKTKMSGTY